MRGNAKQGRGKNDVRDAEVEQEVRRLCARGEWQEATGHIIAVYRPDVCRLLYSALFRKDLVDDAFGHFAECVTRGLPTFRWECSLRTWLLTLARNACHHLRRSPVWREQVMDSASLPEQVYRERTTTSPWLRTDVKERFWALVREKLAIDELALLNLRVVQRQSWKDIARILSGSTEPPSEAQLARSAAALRQQFQRLKHVLRELAMQGGLVPPSTDTGAAAPPEELDSK
jgi:RNA polymerase sigma-70 factor (ECF subfamily)